MKMYICSGCGTDYYAEINAINCAKGVLETSLCYKHTKQEANVLDYDDI